MSKHRARPKAQTAPNGESVWLRYSSYGHLTLESDGASSQTYRQLTATDARGQPTGESYGNGLSATRTYWPASGQVKEIAYSNGRKLNYQYDVYGNLTRQELNGGASSEQLSYDRLHRLTHTSRSGSASGTVTYGYDAAGNFTHKSDYSTTSLSAYQYTGGLGGGGPNAVKTAALKAGGTRSYGYDASGNLTADNAGFSAKYDHSHLPVLLQRTTLINQFAYGADNAKARQWGSDGIRLYAPGYEELGTGEQKSYVGNYLVISKTGTTRTLRFLLTDRLGSVDAITTDTGTLVETRGYDAFGAPRTGTWADATPPKLQSTAITPKGFTQHEHLNSLELIHMNGRSYDYKLGRFMGVDPFIQFPANSQSLNPYSYILNTPLSGTDPTGYAVCEKGKTDDCTNIKQERVAPTGSHIKSNSRFTGQVSDGKTTARVSLTFDKSGNLVSGSISVSNGAKATEDRKDQTTDVTGKGGPASRANVAGAAAVGTVETLPSSGGLSALGRAVAGMVAPAGAAVAAGVLGLAWSSAVGEGSDISDGERLNYGLDAAWSASLAEATRLRNSGSGSVVIGETQPRVDSAAERLGAATINFGEYWFKDPQLTAQQSIASIVYNAGWMTGVMTNRMHIYDIGLDSRPRTRSQNYRIERQMIDLAQYPRYEQKLWEFSGGWDYQNAK